MPIGWPGTRGQSTPPRPTSTGPLLVGSDRRAEALVFVTIFGVDVVLVGLVKVPVLADVRIRVDDEVAVESHGLAPLFSVRTARCRGTQGCCLPPSCAARRPERRPSAGPATRGRTGENLHVLRILKTSK